MSEGTSPRVVRIRVLATRGVSQDLATKIAELLEAEGLEIIEHSTPYPCTYPDADKEKVFLTAIVKGS
jgi:hypothetical protein